jgi:hypothetical protein
MAIQSSIYATDGTTRTYPSTKHIATKQHCSVWKLRVSDSVWEISNVSEYSLVNNSVIFVDAVLTSLYSEVEIRVADTADELLDSPTDIAITATNIADINTNAENIDAITTNATNIASIQNTSGNIGVITNVSNNMADINNAEENANIAISMAAVCTDIYDQFDDRYLGAKATPPLLDNDGNTLVYGALYFDTTNNFMKVWSNAGWINAGSSVNGTTERYTYHATAGQTVFAATYEAGYIDVFLNGSKLENGVDFTAVTATDITLTSPAALNDVVDIICYAVFELSTAPTKDVVAYTVSTVAGLASVPSSYTTAIVKDLNRGGTFIWSSTGTANGGTVFAGATGFWTRQYSGAVNVKWFGAKGDGVTDDTVALQNAINFVFNGGGGDVSIPQGDYLLNGLASSDAYLNGILLPFSTLNGNKSVHLSGAEKGATKIIAGSDNMIVIRNSSSYSLVSNIEIDLNSKINSVGIALVPEIINGNTVQVAQSFNNTNNLYIHSGTIGIMQQCGKGITYSSGCYYNTFSNIHIQSCTTGVYLKTGSNTSPMSSVNRNQYASVRTNYCTTGYYIESGDTNSFFGCSSEGDTTGLKIDNLDGNGISNQLNCFYNFVVEASITKDLVIANTYTKIFGGVFTYSKCTFSNGKILALIGVSDTSIAPVILGGLLEQNNALVPGYEIGLNVNNDIFDIGGKLKAWDLSNLSTQVTNIASYPVSYSSSVRATVKKLGGVVSLFVRMKFQVTSTSTNVTLLLPFNANSSEFVQHSNIVPLRFPVYTVGAIGGISLVWGYFSAVNIITITAPTAGWNAGAYSEIHFVIQYHG